MYIRAGAVHVHFVTRCAPYVCLRIRYVTSEATSFAGDVGFSREGCSRVLLMSLYTPTRAYLGVTGVWR